MNLEEQYDRIYKYLYFRLHDQHTAEDLTQETFLGLLEVGHIRTKTDSYSICTRLHAICAVSITETAYMKRGLLEQSLCLCSW